MRIARYLIPAALFISLATAGKKKDPDDFTQTLAMPKDPPAVVVAETRKLTFHVSPLSGKGLLSQQTRDALKAILKENGGAPVIHIRAFVAGSGDIRRIPQIVSEVFTEKKLPLPSVTVVLCGGLPLTGAQIVIESVSASRKDVNSGGLSFVRGEEETAADANASARPLLEKSLAALAAKAPAAGVLRISCFLSNIESSGDLMHEISSRFSGAAVDVVQTQRGPYRAFADCDAVARVPENGPARLAFTGSRVAFGSAEKDAVLAFQRLDRDLTEAGASPDDIVFTNIYSVHPTAAATAIKLRTGRAPVVTIPFEGVASNDGGFAVDAIAAVANK